MSSLSTGSNPGGSLALSRPSSSLGLGVNLSALETQNELKRRSTLSRLEGVAEGVWM